MYPRREVPELMNFNKPAHMEMKKPYSNAIEIIERWGFPGSEAYDSSGFPNSHFELGARIRATRPKGEETRFIFEFPGPSYTGPPIEVDPLKSIYDHFVP